jgi:hypothetical protein
MATMKQWNGDEIGKAVAQNVAKALGKFGLRVEYHAKKELKKGHGVITATLLRSIHCAQTGYNWSGDNVKPGTGSPDRGNQKFDAVVNGRKITIEVGSGMSYALPVHQGHQSFEGYHFLTIGLEKATPELPNILNEFRLK